MVVILLFIIQLTSSEDECISQVFYADQILFMLTYAP